MRFTTKIFAVVLCTSLLVACSAKQADQTSTSVQEPAAPVAELQPAQQVPEPEAISEPEPVSESNPGPTVIIAPIHVDGIDDATLAGIQQLDNTSSGWGQGTAFDSMNRPGGAVTAQEKYGQYRASFIGEPTNTIYLTMDEGYENGYTPLILDVLKEKNCTATFFVTLDYAKKNPDLIRRMIDEGHVVGNHSKTHPSAGLPSQDLATQVDEVLAVHRYVEEQFGYSMWLFRYPAGIHSPQSLALLQQLGYRTVFWSFAYRDWITDEQPDPAQSLQKVTERLHPGAIYLLHAVSSTNTAILGDFIDNARAQGYTFGVLSNQD